MLPLLLFVGEAPSRKGARALHPDDCASGRRLLEYSGWSSEEYLRLADQTNLFSVPTPATAWHPKNAAWNAGLMRMYADENYHHVVLLGRRVADAFAVMDTCPWFAPVQSGRSKTKYYCCPHTSGRNRWWNDEDNRLAARRFFNRLATEVWVPA